MKNLVFIFALLAFLIVACSTDPVSSGPKQPSHLDSINAPGAPCAFTILITSCSNNHVIDSIAVTVDKKLVGLMNSGSSTTVRLYPGIYDIIAKGRNEGDWHSVVVIEQG